MEDVKKDNKIYKKGLMLLLNLILLFVLIYLQSIRYNNLINLTIEGNNADVLRNVGLMHANGNDMNSIFGLTLVLTFLNIVLYKNWIKAKRWVLEPIFIFIVTFGLTITCHIYRTLKVSEQINVTNNNK
jgi:hypothetical protein